MIIERSHIILNVAHEFNVPLPLILSGKKHEETVSDARHAAVFALSVAGWRYKDISEQMNLSSVYYQKMKHVEKMKKDSEYREKCARIVNNIEAENKLLDNFYKFRCTTEEKSKWLNAARKHGQKSLSHVIKKLLQKWIKGEIKI